MPPFIHEDVVFLETLGKGGFGIVKKAYHKKLERFIALKSFFDNVSLEEMLEQIKLENDLLLKIETIRKNNENSCFLTYDGIFIDSNSKNKNNLLLQMESGICTLDSILKAGKKYSCDELLYVLKKLVMGFTLLQENGIANRDIKPANVILVHDDHDENCFFYKISDFGIGSQISKESYLVSSKTITGYTSKFAAPEVIELAKLEQEKQYNPYVADVYSLGITIFKMMDYSHGKTKLNLLNEKSFFENYPPFQVIFEKMLQKDPNKRFDFKQMNSYLDEIAGSVL